ncbi:iron-containing alcohol dehydrogenase [Nitratireductor kimnyeongensis]|nr:iron-containing alcohol dehydrogenase [Nitratireductor kimnyeongensis]
MARFNYVTPVRFGFGALSVLADELGHLGVGRFLLVTDPGIVEAGLVERVTAVVKPAAIFDQTPSNPTEAAAIKALAAFREAECDGVVALGGGSSIDLAKAVALLATHSGVLADYVIGGGSADAIGPTSPIIAVPTTAGTGAEVGRAASLTLRNGTKAACVNAHLIPRCAICDPDLTLSLPPMLTASTGIDVLCHGIEAYFSSTFNPPADAIALDVVSRSARSLPEAVRNGNNRDARSEMLLAAVMGGMVFQKGLGAIHALTHPLGALGYPHGTLNAIVLPHVLAINEKLAPARATELKSALDNVSGKSLSVWTNDFIAALGLPQRLSALGMTRDGFSDFAEKAEREHLNKTNPRPLTAAEFLTILEAAY